MIHPIRFAAASVITGALLSWGGTALLGQEPEAGALRQGITKLARELMKEHDVPGIAITLIRDGKVAWFQPIGWADKATEKPIALPFHSQENCAGACIVRCSRQTSPGGK